MKKMLLRIGVLDIQGSVEEHFEALKRLGKVCVQKSMRRANFKIEPILVKNAKDLEKVSGLIIPGGESTTVGKLLRRFGLRDAIIKRAKKGMAIWGTCAGAILLAKKIAGKENADSLGIMDITVERNAFGRQLDSFETFVNFDFGEKTPEKIPAVFIRAPKIVAVGKNVKILAKNNGEIVAAREGNLIATTFHPELTDSLKVHEYFTKEVFAMCGL